MKQNEFEVSVRFQGCRYAFPFGSQAYIFHTGILNGFYDRYGTEILLQYVDFVHKCYMKDNERTPLGALADYIAGNWEMFKGTPSRAVLDEFYACNV